MAASHSIWEHLAPWSGPERLYELMQRCHAGTLSKPQENEYAMQLLRVVYMQFQQHRLTDKLNHVRADVEGVIQDVAQHLRRQSLRGFNLKAQGWKPMMTTMNTAVRNFVMTEILKASRLHQRQATATDYFTDRGAGEEPGMDSGVGAGEARSSGALDQALDAAEDALIGDVVCSAAESELLESLVQAIRRQILLHRTPLPHAALPFELKEVSRELHGLLVARILRVVRDFAAA